jgi:hypothetical protein
MLTATGTCFVATESRVIDNWTGVVSTSWKPDGSETSTLYFPSPACALRRSTIARTLLRSIRPDPLYLMLIVSGSCCSTTICCGMLSSSTDTSRMMFGAVPDMSLITTIQSTMATMTEKMRR